MSLDYNPYKHFEVVDVPDTEGYQVRWYCHGCGADGPPQSCTISVVALRQGYHAHILGSHGRPPAAFEGWSDH